MDTGTKITSVDLIVEGATVVTMDPERRILPDGAVCVSGATIVAVGGSREIHQAYRATEVIDASNKVLVPGFINTHTHIFQTFLRGIGQDLPAVQWLKRAIDPVVGHLSLEDSYLSALLGGIEAIKSGTTTILEYNYANPLPEGSDEVIKALGDAGIRGIFARGILDMGELHPDIIQDTDSELAECERLIQTYNGLDDGMISIWIAPYTIMSASPEAFKQSRSLADQYGVWLTVHAATPSTIEASLAQYGSRDLQWEDSIGFLGSDVLAVHCCGELMPDDLALMKNRDVKVSHNPASNCYLGEGIAPVREFVARGIPVGLATDGPSSNNNLDMVASLKLASLLQKVKYLDPSALTAYKVLEMATIEAASAVGAEAMIGSIEVGKKADLVLFDLWKPNCIAVHDPVAALVYSATQESVDTVIVNGRIVLRDRELKTVQEDEVLKRSQAAARSLLKRSGFAEV